jgi:hypothetical protein
VKLARPKKAAQVSGFDRENRRNVQPSLGWLHLQSQLFELRPNDNTTIRIFVGIQIEVILMVLLCWIESFRLGDFRHNRIFEIWLMLAF